MDKHLTPCDSYRPKQMASRATATKSLEVSEFISSIGAGDNPWYISSDFMLLVS